ncbi:MAG: class I SAM-dependent methyltransferase [Erysipelotrichaceae bacterium]
MSYQKIAKYYADIFPMNLSTLNFLDKHFKGNKATLDIGCGSGEYAIGLAKRNYPVSALDLDPEMIQMVNAKADIHGVPLHVVCGSMLELPRYYQKQKFHNVYCIGNSLAHVSDLAQLTQVLADIYQLMEMDGTFVLQIINYDRVMTKHIKGLPLIENKEKHLRFERYYELEDPNVIFKTVMSVDGEVSRSETTLFAIRQDALMDALSAVGFHSFETYGNFNEVRFEPMHSQPLIVTCKK